MTSTSKPTTTNKQQQQQHSPTKTTNKKLCCGCVTQFFCELIFFFLYKIIQLNGIRCYVKKL